MKKTLFIALFFVALPIICQSGDILWQKNYSWGQVSSLEFSQDSKYLAVYLSTPRQVDIIRVQDSTLVKTIPYQSLPKFTTDGKYLATVNSTTFTLTDVNSLETFKVVDLGYETDRFEFANDMSFMACSGGKNGAVLLFDTQNYKLMKRIDDVPILHDPKYGDRKGAQYISVSFDNKKLAYSNELTSFVYDLEKDNVKLKVDGRIPKFSPTRNELLLIKLKNDGQQNVLDGLYHYNFDYSNEPEHINFGVLNFNFSPDGNYIVRFGDYPANVDIFDFKNKIIKYNFKYINDYSYGNAIINNSNRYLVTESGILFVIDLGLLLGIKEQQLVENFNVFPNPTNENLIISYSVKIPSHIELRLSNLDASFDRTIKSEFQNSGIYSENYSILDLPNGTYFITLKINEKIYSQKINIVR